MKHSKRVQELRDKAKEPKCPKGWRTIVVEGQTFFWQGLNGAFEVLDVKRKPFLFESFYSRTAITPGLVADYIKEKLHK